MSAQPMQPMMTAQPTLYGGGTGYNPYGNSASPSPMSSTGQTPNPYAGGSFSTGNMTGAGVATGLGAIGSAIGGDAGSALSGLGGLYGAYTGASNSQNILNASNAGFGMAEGAYNPQNFGFNGVGGTGFSVSSPTNGGPGSISSSLGAFNPMYGNYANASSGYLGQSQNLANTASSGATGAYQSALSSIMPQLQQMQGNLLASNNNALFQRGQLGSGSFGQNTAGGANNPVNLTTQSLGSGFAQQDLNAIQLAQNQGLNFYNSNLQGATALGGLGLNTTNTGLGMINAQNAVGQTPLQYSQLYGQQNIGATNANSLAVQAGNNTLNSGNTGYGGLATGLASGLNGILNGTGTSSGLAGALSGVGNGISSLLGGGSAPAGTGGASGQYSYSPYSGTYGTGFNPTGGPDGTAYAPGVSQYDPSQYTGDANQGLNIGDNPFSGGNDLTGGSTGF
jgi:hypothetical protein